MKNPKFLVRPSDSAIYVLQEDGKYISKHTLDKNIQNHIGNRFTYETLTSHDFYICTEKDFPRLERAEKLFHEFTNWKCRPDGHGGIKGGTMEEFLSYQKTLEKYLKSKK